MKRRFRGAGVLALLSLVLLLACAGESPSGPSSTPPPTSTSPPPSGQDLSLLLGVWNIDLRMTEVTGNGCVADTMRSRRGAPASYSLSITPTTVTLKSASSDRACTYSPKMNSTSFTTYAQGGYYSCGQFFLDFTCSDGTHHQIFTIGEDVSGAVEGEQISGTWDAYWFDGMNDYVGFDMKAQFTGSRAHNMRRSGMDGRR